VLSNFHRNKPNTSVFLFLLPLPPLLASESVSKWHQNKIQCKAKQISPYLYLQVPLQDYHTKFLLKKNIVYKHPEHFMLCHVVNWVIERNRVCARTHACVCVCACAHARKLLDLNLIWFFKFRSSIIILLGGGGGRDLKHLIASLSLSHLMYNSIPASLEAQPLVPILECQKVVIMVRVV
jgi:hypothetical protein